MDIDVTPTRDQYIREIINGLNRYETSYDGLTIRFLDRENEAREILGLGRGVIEDDQITILYGPKGCGKTTFFMALINALLGFRDKAWEIHYVSMDDTRRNIVVLSTDEDMIRGLLTRIRSRALGFSFEASLNPFPTIPVGTSISISKRDGFPDQLDAIASAMEVVEAITTESLAL